VDIEEIERDNSYDYTKILWALILDFLKR